VKVAPFEYHRPRSAEEAVRILADVAPHDGRVLAGGQSLVPIMAFRLASPAHLVDINKVEEFSHLDVRDDCVAIGACVRHAAFYVEVAPGATGRILKTIVPHIAHHPIRGRGTFCGSLAHADPASEWCLVTAMLDGRMMAQSLNGVREISAADYFQGVMTTSLEPYEILVEARLPLLSNDTRFGFCEFNRRVGDFAIAMVLATYRLVDGRIAEPRIGIGGAEAFPRRLPEAEAALLGNEPSNSVFTRAAEIARQTIEPLEDEIISSAYRRSLAATLTRRALEQTLSQ
jgi:carbon-monoxide dehydrogenase medium subunit